MPDGPNMTAEIDAQLAISMLLGNIASFGNIVEKYWNMVIALALTKIADPVEAEDIAQRSFLKAYSQWYILQKPSRFVGWFTVYD